MNNSLKHLAIIMDGNGRWAEEKSLARVKGHEAGAERIEEVAKTCVEHGVETLSLYTFSTENWKRPKLEVDFLMKLLNNFLKTKKKLFLDNEIKFSTMGDLSLFSKEIQRKIQELKEVTKDFTKLDLVIALNYGSRDELVRAFKKISEKNEVINEENISAELDNPKDIDLLIRTGKEKRLSNFMLWQASYAELHFSSTLWPDFSSKELEEIINNFKFINRRFGGL